MPTKVPTTISISITVVMLAGVARAGDPKAKMPEPTKAMEMPKAPHEIGERVKAMSGTWRCDGSTLGMDGSAMKFKGTMTSRAELDGFWVHDSFNGTMGTGKGAMKFRFESYATFDPAAKKWRSLFMDNAGGQMVATADPMKDGKLDTIGDMTSMMGKSQFKDHVDVSDKKKGAHMWGEESRDGGRTWKPVYDMICKK
jgi:Protein of unknown function (DUF1579)